MSHTHDDPVFDLACYMIASARLSLDEAPRYGSTRLLVATSRLIEASKDLNRAGADEVLQGWKQAIDTNMFKVMDEYPVYVEWLGGLARAIAEEARERNLGAA